MLICFFLRYVGSGYKIFLFMSLLSWIDIIVEEIFRKARIAVEDLHDTAHPISLIWLYFGIILQFNDLIVINIVWWRVRHRSQFNPNDILVMIVLDVVEIIMLWRWQRGLDRKLRDTVVEAGDRASQYKNKDYCLIIH